VPVPSTFEMEMYRVKLLMQRLGLTVNEYEAPNSKVSGGERR
jgi:hypothetical protein